MVSFTAVSNDLFYLASSGVEGLSLVGEGAKYVLNATAQKIKNFVTSPSGQIAIGFVLGTGMMFVYGPLTERIVKHLVVDTGALPADPFSGFGITGKLLMAPLICVACPTMEEIMFRGDLPTALTNKLSVFYTNYLRLSDSLAVSSARVTSLLLASLVFGLMHFTNALVFWCSPIAFLPQVIAATIMGVILGLAKEFSGELYMPIGMHIGNNTLAWTVL